MIINIEEIDYEVNVDDSDNTIEIVTNPPAQVDVVNQQPSVEITIQTQGAQGAKGADGDDGEDGIGIPTGGTTGQVARKASGTNYDVEWHTLVKSDVGLSNADNTSDANKPVSTAQATAIGVVQSDVDAHEANTSNPHSVTKTQVGLSNVDNTSDASKPVSTAQQTSLDLKAPLASPTFTGTVAGITKTMVGLSNVDNTADASKTLAGDITGTLAAATIASGAVTDAKGSLSNKPAVTVVATTNQALTGLPIIDGFQTTATSLVLLTAQSTGSQNGPWQAQAGAWTRPTWYPSGGTTQAFQFITTLIRLGTTYAGTVWRITTSGAITIDTTATTWVITKITLNALTSTKATSLLDGFLSAADWTTFNNKLDSSRFNYITNPDAEVNATGWNLYDDSGRTVPAFVLNQDLTFTAVASGNSGNGINVRYDFHATQPSATPLVTVVSPTLITVAWYNGPTLANNPTATQLKAAFDAIPGAVALATCAISGTAGNRQYIDGSHVLANGGDAAPTDGTSGTPTDLVFSRSTSAPLVGLASFLLAKGASSQYGTGVSTDLTINSADKGNPLQVSFYYSGDAGMVFGSASDVKIFLLDITNNVMLPLTIKTLTGPTAGTIYRYAAQFTASASSVLYRLIVHTSTVNATAWNLKLDTVTVSSVLDAATATQVPSVVLPAQPILISVTDRMAVMWQDGNTSWRPATMASGADESTLFGFATNIVGLTADITIRGKLGGFSFGPFVGYNQYVDTTAGGISPSPSPFTDTYVVMGKALTSDTIMVEPTTYRRRITSKGGLLSNSGVNTGTGDQVLAVGANGNVLCANSAQTLGLQWLPAVVAAAPFTYTLATRTLTIAVATDSVAGVMSAADHTILSGHTTTLALKAPLASPVFTGDVNVSTGNALVSTLGKGLQVKTGTNSKLGTATLVAGTVTVANTSVTANSRIFVCCQTDGGTPGWLRVSAKVVGTSFTITSSSASDTSVVAWHIIESIP